MSHGCQCPEGHGNVSVIHIRTNWHSAYFREGLVGEEEVQLLDMRGITRLLGIAMSGDESL